MEKYMYFKYGKNAAGETYAKLLFKVCLPLP